MARGPIPDFPRDRPTIPDVVPLLLHFYKHEENESGGYLHIALEDCNVRDHDLEYCHISACMENNDLARLIIAAMYRRAPDERRQIMGWDDYYAVDSDGNNLWPESSG